MNLHVPKSGGRIQTNKKGFNTASFIYFIPVHTVYTFQ